MFPYAYQLFIFIHPLIFYFIKILRSSDFSISHHSVALDHFKPGIDDNTYMKHPLKVLQTTNLLLKNFDKMIN